MKKIKGLLSLLALIILVSVFNVADAKAYTPNASVTTFSQTDATANSITVSFTGANAVKYNVYKKLYSDYTAEYQYVTTLTQAGSYTVGGLESGTAYYIKIVPINSEGKEGYYRYTKMVTLISKLTGLHQEKWWKYNKAIDIQWNPLDAATGYDYIVKKRNGKIFKKGEVSGYSKTFSVSNIKNEEIYVVQVRAKQNFAGRMIYTDWVKIDCFVQPTVTAATVRNGELKIKWGKVSGATGYTVYACTKNGKAKDYKRIAKLSKKKNTYTIKKIGKSKIKANKTYYVYVTTKYKKSQSQPVYYYKITGTSVTQGWI